MKRFLPPLLLILIVGLVAWRTLARPQRESARIRIEARWEQSDESTREVVVSQTSQYLLDFPGEGDRRFAAHAFLRARRLDKAVQARWPDIDRSLPPQEVKDFAKEALIALGWDDEARTRPSIQHTQAALALIEGGDEPTRLLIEKRIATEPIEDLYSFMRRSVRLRGAIARDLFARACRARAQAEAVDDVPDPNWSVVAALLALDREVYPERDADISVLLQVLTGPFRIQYNPRWTLACRELGASEDPRALEALRAQLATLEGSGDARDGRDRVFLQLALLGAGDWTYAPEVRVLFKSNDKGLRALRTFCPEVLVDRWQRGDERALATLGSLWMDPGATDPNLREVVARGLLLGGPTAPTALPFGGELTLESLLADLEAKAQPSTLKVLALAYRLRRGEPGARDALVRWLAYDPGVAIGQKDPERASQPLLLALRALYLYD